MITPLSTTAALKPVVNAQVRIPLYQGGLVVARSRQAHQVAGQRRFEADSVRDQVRSSLTTAWGQLRRREIDERQRRRCRSQQPAWRSSGVREAARLGERTNYDVLNTEEDLNDALVDQINARRDIVMSSYAIALSTGALDFTAMESLLGTSWGADLSSSEPETIDLGEAIIQHAELPQLKGKPSLKLAETTKKAGPAKKALVVLRPTLDK